MSIQVIVAMQEGGEERPVFEFQSDEAAAGFISDLFDRYGNDVCVAVALDGAPVEWSYDDGVLTIGEPINTPSLH